MKRFVDMRQIDEAYDFDFAWFCTVTNRFEMFNKTMVWDNWKEFESDFRHDTVELHSEIIESRVSRYEGLCPGWVKK